MMLTQEIKRLSVRLYGKEVGILQEYKGKMRFQYNKNAQAPLSFSLPIREEVYTEKYCKAYFGGLLPENQEIRKALAMQFKINANNDFALLAAIGQDCAGAVSFHRVDEPQLEELFMPLKGKFVTDTELEEYIKELPVKPFLGRKLSLAGVQEKTPICVIDGEIVIPDEGIPTTHILKPPLTRFKQSVANEYICMETAKSIGLIAPLIEIRKAGETEFFLIKRFDRLNRNNTIMRLHHEDFTQILGVWTENKYQVTFKNCLTVLNLTSRPALEKMRFLSLAVFNYLIGNCDAHGKNFSLLHLKNETTLAPVYDVLCTSVYDLDNKMAMKIGKAQYASEVTHKDWLLFSDHLDINPSLTLEELDRQINILPNILKTVVTRQGAEIGHEIFNFVVKNCENAQKSLKK